MDTTPAKLRIVFEHNDIRKLVLPSGIPRTLEELICELQEAFHIPGEFTVMYQDMDFDGQFCTSSCIEDVEDKGTLTVFQTEPIVLNLSPVEVLDIDSSIAEQSSDNSSRHSSGPQDTILLSYSGTSYRSELWPAKFQVPTFSYDVDVSLEAGNQAYQKDGTLLSNPRLRSSVLEKLAEEIFRYTAYPTGVQVLAVLEALLEKYPCLKEPGSFNGMYGWQQRIRYKMGNYRSKLRCRTFACPELEVNSRKSQASNKRGPKGIKRPKKAEVNQFPPLPPLPIGETGDTLERERIDLLNEIKKKNNDKIIGEKMERSFSYRRLEVVQHCPAVHDFMERWPAMFSELQLFTVFEGVKSTGVNLTAVTAPLNTENVKSVEQTETSITLRWKNVDATFNYTLVINGEEMNVPASADTEAKHTIPDLPSGTKYNFQLFTVFEGVKSTGVNLTAVTADTEVKHTIPDLTNGTKYNFQLFTVFEYARSTGVNLTAVTGVKSTGVNLTAVTAPLNTENVKSVEQTETSITLRWKNVDATFNYTLVIKGEEMNVPASADTEVKHTIPDLTNGTKYNFQLFTVFEYARNTGVNLTAVTAPLSAGGFRTVTQNETSITLQWDKVDDIINYTLGLNGKEIFVTATADIEVKHTTSQLTSGTKYNFQLFTVFEYARSTGVNLTAVTAPLSAGGFQTVTQNETSITLRWDKVDAILNYRLGLDGKEFNVTGSDNTEVKHTTSKLTSGAKYNFQLFAVFVGVKSTAVNLTAVTAPRNTEEFKSVGQNETSITLQWNNLKKIFNYTLVFNEKEIHVPASEEPLLTQTITELTSGIKYELRLFTVFENVNSTGVNYTAVT
ncbi:hypothetical protein KUCAC02_027709, partial [Chaenocephalus aceratus]